jgi:hypothetical protein
MRQRGCQARLLRTPVKFKTQNTQNPHSERPKK